MGDTVHFLTGVDEHGQKVQAGARKRGIPPQQFCDEVSAEFIDENLEHRDLAPKGGLASGCPAVHPKVLCASIEQALDDLVMACGSCGGDGGIAVLVDER